MVDGPDDGAPALARLPDGTARERSPWTDEVTWTTPRRARRPGLGGAPPVRTPADPALQGRRCAFCPERRIETPPEKARLLPGPGWAVLRDVPADRLLATDAEVRVVPNLVEILGVEHWRAVHGWRAPPDVVARADAYTASPAGREHVLSVLRRRAAADGVPDEEWAARSEGERLARAVDLFAGTHDVVIAREHLVRGARFEDELAGPGTLTPDGHHRFVRFTIEAAEAVRVAQPAVRYVAVFQNWLRPAGASFDHLHKQVVGIDVVGPRTQTLLDRFARDPDVVVRSLAHARRSGLVVARTPGADGGPGAVAVVGLGRPYPSVEVHATGRARALADHPAAQVRAVSDVLHAVHAAVGPDVATNEEWYHQPVDGPALPWHVVVAQRRQTPAGFEATTGVHVTTVDPAVLREELVQRLHVLRDAGAVAPVLLLGDERR